MSTEKAMELNTFLSRSDLPQELRTAIEEELAWRTQLEEQARAQARMLQSILDSMSSGVAVANRQGRFVLFNRAAEEILGMGAVESGFEHWPEAYGIFRPDGLTPFPAEEQPIVLALAGETRGAVEMVIRNPRRPDGLYITVTARPWLDEDGSLLGGVAVFRDITELRQTQAQLEALNSELELRVEERTAELRDVEQQLHHSQKMEAIGRLAGGIAHDFNNQLTAILGYSELALSDVGPDSPLVRPLERIQRAGERAANLTRQLLAFSRRQVLQPRLIDLNEATGAVRSILERVISEDVELAFLAAPALPAVRIDPEKLEQVLMNLAINARDAMPSGGKLTLETECVVLDEDYAARHPEVRPGPHVMLAVSDTGVGMTPEVCERIFEPFFTTKESGRGTGLGLSMVHGFVKQSGGHLWVYSEPGQGTTFRIYFPAVEDPAEPLEPPRSASAGPGGHERILLAEDEELAREMIADALRGAGYRVLVAASGTEALEIGCREPVDLLLTDAVLPGMGGRELAERLSAARPDVCVLYMSGYTENAIVHHGVLDPGIAFVQKPVSLQVLLGKVREVLDRAQRSR
ncbi:MAG TPA: ATP-binding protein [Planctomycetota bacterium]|nr:ATP-binding protein [Planctomycetota bacterium]